ncbi:MAG TPA: dTDP-4-dehydrorhamnose 3,5-epimerase [Gemmatimonadaceae bacterium]|nr:dTDP-4-dehydrorhamnose 3,5-epimerase [Gemmatimonadaceae bacterium]
MRVWSRQLAIPDVVLIEHETYVDDRGYFMEVYRRDAFQAVGLPEDFVQLNESRSARNVIRGLHFQWDPPMGKLMRVAEGAAFLVAVDIRHGSPTLGRWVGETITSEDRREIWAPAGFARGICALADNTRVQYLCTGTYNGTAESGINWSDPEIGIVWPVATPRLSPKDRSAQTLQQWLARPESKRFSL